MVYLMSSQSAARRSRNSHGSKQSKNPFSSRGLDEFSALLAELEEKKQKIYSESRQGEAPMIRFVYTSSNDCVPIVIRPKDRLSDQEMKKKKRICKRIISFKQKDVTHSPKSTTDSIGSKSDSDKETKKPIVVEDTKQEKECELKVVMHKMKRPSYYLPMTVILILVFLALFGRSFAIMCTSIGWYLVPTIKGWNTNGKMSMKKKYFERKLSYANDGNNSMKKKDMRRWSSENDGNYSMKKKDYVRKFSTESRGSASPQGHDSPTIKDKFPCLAAHQKTG